MLVATIFRKLIECIASGHFLQKLLNYWAGQVQPSEQIMNVHGVKLSGYNLENSNKAHFFGYIVYRVKLSGCNIKKSLDIPFNVKKLLLLRYI